MVLCFCVQSQATRRTFTVTKDSQYCFPSSTRKPHEHINAITVSDTKHTNPSIVIGGHIYIPHQSLWFKQIVVVFLLSIVSFP